jgi:hypothetical protein
VNLKLAHLKVHRVCFSFKFAFALLISVYCRETTSHSLRQCWHLAVSLSPASLHYAAIRLPPSPRLQAAGLTYQPFFIIKALASTRTHFKTMTIG